MFIVSVAVWLALTGVSPAASESQANRSAGLPDTAGAVVPLPSGDQIIRRMMVHSAALAQATNAPAWAYDKRMVMECLASDGKVEERDEKLYRVRIIRGVPFSRLVSVSGHDLSAAEIKQENEREAAFQKQISGRDPKKAVKQREALITEGMIARFDYQVLRRESVQGRQTIVVRFAPKPGTDSGSIQNRLLSRLAGTLWVDETTGDVARLKVQMTKELSLGLLGVLGAIKDCRMNIDSKPMADGTWLPEKTTMSLSARMLLASVRFQMQETSSNFTLEPTSEVAPQ